MEVSGERDIQITPSKEGVLAWLCQEPSPMDPLFLALGSARDNQDHPLRCSQLSCPVIGSQG